MYILLEVKAIQEECQVKGVKVLLLHFKTKNSPFFIVIIYLRKKRSLHIFLNNIFKTELF